MVKKHRIHRTKLRIIIFIPIILVILIIIAIIYLCVPGGLIRTYGTLTLAIATVFAVFYQNIIKYATRPRFDVEFAPNDNEIRLKITNTGGSTAHLCKVAIEVYGEDSNIITHLFLPWGMRNSNTFITYNGIILYKNEYEFVQLFIQRNHVLFIPESSPFQTQNNSVVYKIKLTVFCEEVSQRCLKTIYFRVNRNNSCSYGFTEGMNETPFPIQ